MKKINRLRTNNFRTIRKSFSRFISLIVMGLLGVLVFVGLSATSPDMLNTLDKFLDESNTYDVKIISSMGVTDNDIESLKSIDNVSMVEGIYSKEVLVEKDENEYVLSISSLPESINTLELIEGRLPISSEEIVVEENLLAKEGYRINDKIVVDEEKEEFLIVGTIRSSLYFNNTKINQNRGATTVGTGTINYYSYVMKDNFDQDYYNSIYLTVMGAKDEVTSNSKYNDIVDNVIEKIEDIKSDCEEDRYNHLYNKALNEIEDNERKINTELNKVKKELDSSKKKLDSAKKTLDDSLKELKTVKQQLDNGKKELDNGILMLENTLKENNISNLEESLKSINSSISNLEKQLSILDKNSLEYEKVNMSLIELNSNKMLLEKLVQTKKELDDNLNFYNQNLEKYNAGYRSYQEGLKQYNTNIKKYNEGYKEYKDNKEKYDKEIEEAKQQLNDLDRPKWFIYSRDDNQTYSSYINQTNSIKSLAGVFPLVFYAVAILVSLISMNRMVEDDRLEIGTLKSLGFSNRDIKRKYITFSFSATLIGAVLGCIIGLTVIPYLIFSIYRLLFDVPNFQFSLNIVSTLIGIIIANLCICGTSIITANKVLKEKPSLLMRPKVPKTGKKIFLENFKWLWHRIKFSNKITIRNIFRYKKRVVITIIGICGCTALMLCGFGIKDSIVDITNMQYVETFTYDAIVYTNNLNVDNVSNLLDNDNIVDYTLSETIAGSLEESNLSIIVTDNNDIEKIVNLVDASTNEKMILGDDEVIITDKIADIYNIKVGDTVHILDNDKKEYDFKISHIAKNYMGHYLYVNKNVINNKGTEYVPNNIYLDTLELNDKDKDKLANDLLKNDEIINVVNTSLLVNSAQDMLNSLDKVVVILVLLAAMLSFVVLYNLANINISERKREISTLKVLGFYDNEVDSYITKEMIILTIFGISLGLIFGYFLTNTVISTVEMENARFIRHIKLNSYLYASCISLLFTIIVNFVTHFALKKINMIESLKSVE